MSTEPTLRERFRTVADPAHQTTLDELAALFDDAASIDEQFLIGEWDGGHFGLGHPIEKQLDALRWAGKSFTDRETVSPIVCFDSSGHRIANPVFGGARLRTVAYRGAPTATMIYDEQPMADHFRRIDDDTVIGAMEAEGRGRPGYFYLTRTVAADSKLLETLAFRPQRPPLHVEAAVVRTPGGSFAIETVELEQPRPDELLVRIAATGLCHSDLTVAALQVPGQSPIVLGHEGAGTVVAVGENVREIGVGDRVVLSYAWCGHCRNCLRGKMAYCTDAGTLNLFGVRADGSTGMRGPDGDIRGRFCGQSSFAGYALAAAHTAVRVPDDIPFEVLAPLGCGAQTGAGTILNSLRPEPGSTLAIFGAGSVGLSALLAARVAGCAAIFAVDPLESRRELARSLGATAAFAPDEARDAIRAATGGLDYSLDCVGTPEAIRTALAVLGSPGVCATVGMRGTANPIVIDQTKLIGKGQAICGVVEGDSVPATFIPELIDLYRNGRFPIDRLVTTYPFEKINDAVADTRNGSAVKAVLISEIGAARPGTM